MKAELELRHGQSLREASKQQLRLQRALGQTAEEARKSSCERPRSQWAMRGEHILAEGSEAVR
eukprot:8053407-Alexandrium_andersonii.AAC.1